MSWCTGGKEIEGRERETHGPDKVAKQEAGATPTERGRPADSVGELLRDRLAEDVARDGEPDERDRVPGRLGKHFEVRRPKEANRAGHVPIAQRGVSMGIRLGEEKSPRDAPGLVDLLEVKGL